MLVFSRAPKGNLPEITDCPILNSSEKQVIYIRTSETSDSLH